jgi:hypothetical protein
VEQHNRAWPIAKRGGSEIVMMNIACQDQHVGVGDLDCPVRRETPCQKFQMKIRCDLDLHPVCAGRPRSNSAPF